MNLMVKAKAKTEERKFTKEQIIKSEKYRNFYVLNEVLKDNVLYTINDIDLMLEYYGRKAGE